MLGVSSQNFLYKTINNFTSPADYLDYMFGGVQGIMYRATIDPKYFQGFYRASGLISALYKNVSNCYVSMNSFYRTRGLRQQEGRDVAHLKRLNALYVDIDCYKVGLSKREVLMELEDEYIGAKIPVPTFIIDSGRGIYLVWKLRNEDKRALPRWSAVQQYLTDTLSDLGADQACTDAARILRVPFSHNKKSDSTVTIEEFNDVTYSIYEIAKEYEISSCNSKSKKKAKTTGIKYPYNHATEAQRKYVKDLAAHLELPEAALPDFTSFQETDSWIKLHKAMVFPHREENKDYCYKKGETYSLPEYKSIKSTLRNYCSEIRKLFKMRNGENCKRELGLFLYRYFLREMKHSSEDALKETLAFNASLDCPFEDAYVTKVTASADRRIEKGIPYAYKKSTIIKILEITKEELEKLPFFAAGVKERAERKKEANRKAYESRLSAEGKAAKKDAILSRRASILAMQEQGKKAVEIQKELKISRATYHRDIAALAIASVMDAARAVLEEQIRKVTNTVKKAAETVQGAAESAKKTGVVAAVRAAIESLRNNVKLALSQKFSLPFMKMLSFAELHGGEAPVSLSDGIRWLLRKMMGDRSGDDGSSN